MRLAIMQPYLFPYIGYFQLMNAVDKFVVYDNIEYTKKGWINRNRILVNGKDQYITLPLRKDSDFLQIKDRYLAESWTEDKKKMRNRIIESYRKAPFFNEAFPIIDDCILFEDGNLFNFIHHSIRMLKGHFGLAAEIITASSVPADHELKAEQKVVSICKAIKATIYINAIGGLELYSKEHFANEGLELCFLKTNQIEYKQFDNNFIPFLSIVDVMMFNSKENISAMLNQYSLI